MIHGIVFKRTLSATTTITIGASIAGSNDSCCTQDKGGLDPKRAITYPGVTIDDNSNFKDLVQFVSRKAYLI